MLICSFKFYFSATVGSSCRAPVAEKDTLFTTLPRTVSYLDNFDIRTWPILGQDEPASQISRSKVISFEKYCPYTHRHTHATDWLLYKDHWSGRQIRCNRKLLAKQHN